MIINFHKNRIMMFPMFKVDNFNIDLAWDLMNIDLIYVGF